MKHTKIIKFLLVLGLLSGSVFAQQTKQTLIKYMQTTKTGKNSDATLILYTDTTFLNYSVFKDIQNQEVYVWYAYGKYQMHANQIFLTSPVKNTKANEIMDLIKSNYKTRIDYRMVDNYYEFVYEKYTAHSIIITENAVNDPDKQLEYKDITTNN